MRQVQLTWSDGDSVYTEEVELLDADDAIYLLDGTYVGPYIEPEAGKVWLEDDNGIFCLEDSQILWIEYR